MTFTVLKRVKAHIRRVVGVETSEDGETCFVTFRVTLKHKHLGPTTKARF